MQQHFTIIGTGLYLPPRRLTAEDVDRRAGLPDGWTRKHTGVLNRHECSPPETLASMALEAIGLALREAAMDWSDLDLLIDGSTCRHQPIPCNAAYLQHARGPSAAGVPCMDIHSTCLGFILSLHAANALLATGMYRHIMLVCSETALKGVNWREPESACLMGDGAAAVLLRRAEPGPTYHFAHQTLPEHLDACHVRGGGFVLPPMACTAETEHQFRFHMDGRRLLHVACRYLPPMAARLVEDSGLPGDDLQVIPHQAAPRALGVIRRRLGVPPERFHDRVAQLGNLIAASIPAVLHLCRREGVVDRGMPLMLLGTSAGYSQAGLIFRL
jgi:3-oxoacyl-[acyl-carrier-protein] synthase III